MLAVALCLVAFVGVCVAAEEKAATTGDAGSPIAAPASPVVAAPAPPAPPVAPVAPVVVDTPVAPVAPVVVDTPPAVAPAPAPVPPAPQLEFAPFNDKVFLEAKRSGAPIGLYFEADWCHPCRQMHEKTFHDAAVLEAAAGYRLFRVDMTRPNAYLDLVQKSFQILGAPTVILFGPDGKERSRKFGFIAPKDFASMLDDASTPAPAS